MALYTNVKTHECIWPSAHAHISLCISLHPSPTQVGTAQPQQEGDGFDGRVLSDHSYVVLRGSSEDCGLAHQYFPVLQLHRPAGRSERCPAPQLHRHDRKAGGMLRCLDMTHKIPPVRHSQLRNTLIICDANLS